MIKTIEKPDVSKIRESRIVELIQNKDLAQPLFFLIRKATSPYASWSEVRRWSLPEDVRPEELWRLIQLMRITNYIPSVIHNINGKPFVWPQALLHFEEVLHNIDMKLGGNLLAHADQEAEPMHRRLINRGIMEESIASSQLEGASTTRKMAKKMLIEGRKPRTRHEQMIVNNYNAMQLIEDEFSKKPLDEITLLSLHNVLTTKTMDDESESGRYRTEKDGEIVVSSRDDAMIYYVAPPEQFLRKEIKRFLAYANDELNDSYFVHPVIKASFLHFWMGYLHPFIDGNGRMARALFYWYLLRKGYWAFGYLPLSASIKKSPNQYRDVYWYSEQDGSDLGYFLDYSMRKIFQSMGDFDKYLQRMSKENVQMSGQARHTYGFNDRQIQLLQYFYKNKDATISVTTHIKIYGVARMTAINDLKGLLNAEFIVSKKVGRVVLYSPTEKVVGLFE